MTVSDLSVPETSGTLFHLFQNDSPAVRSTDYHLFLAAWVRVRDAWLDTKTALSGSEQTRRAYAGATDSFWQFADVDPAMITDKRRQQDALTEKPEYGWRAPWLIGAADAYAYRVWLAENHSPATVAQYLAINSSFYAYVISSTFVGATGVEVSLFMDARGITKSNPFRHSTVGRPKVDYYGKAAPISPGDPQRFFDAIDQERRPLVRARDKALFSIYLLTGRRAAEVVRLRWGDIRKTGDNTYELIYVGKGYGQGLGDSSRKRKQALPMPAYDLLVEYLKVDGRWPDIRRDEYIFRPISDIGIANLGNVDPSTLKKNRHIAVRRVGQIMDKICARAGLPHMHPHQFRHSFAQGVYETTKDIRLVQLLLGHEHISTTQVYLAAMEPTKDTFSKDLLNHLDLKL